MPKAMEDALKRAWAKKSARQKGKWRGGKGAFIYGTMENVKKRTKG